MKLKTTIAAGALGACLAGAVALNSCGSPVAPIAAHGTLETSVSILDGSTPADAYPDITDGGQVVIVNSVGAVIATGTLNAATSTTGFAVTNHYTFAVTVPGGLPRYGVEVGHNRGVLWFTAKQMASKQSLNMCLGDGC